MTGLVDEQRLAVKIQQRVEPRIAVRYRHQWRLSVSDNKEKAGTQHSHRRAPVEKLAATTLPVSPFRLYLALRPTVPNPSLSARARRGIALPDPFTVDAGASYAFAPSPDPIERSLHRIRIVFEASDGQVWTTGTDMIAPTLDSAAEYSTP